MKIDIYTLLGLVKDGKAPKKIKYSGIEYNLIEGDYVNEFGVNILQHLTYTEYIMTHKVEILEEPKKIEKLPYYSLEKIQKSKNKDEWYENRLKLLEKRINDYHNKFNELIDEINNLKEK